MGNLQPGTRVRYGSTLAEIVRADRRYRQEGYLVWDLAGPGDPGSVRGNPRWVPASSVTVAGPAC